jgi:AcrR family transcriptional regulator
MKYILARHENTNVRAIVSKPMIYGSQRRDREGQVGVPRTHGEQTRQAILTRALKVAAREGMAALTIGHLAEELRMSKSGLFSHFRSKRALELATLEMAREVFADAVLRPALASQGGVKRLWTLCDLWLQHIEGRVFTGAYFFTGAFFEYADRPGPIAEAITRVAREWFNTLRKAVQEAQEQGEINPGAKAKQIAWELIDRLVGAYWAFLLERGGHFREVRIALLDRFQELATLEIPATAFESVRAWKEYLQRKS